MSSTINSNISSLNSQSSLARTQVALATSMQRLSSGLRVNSAKDDAAGLAIATRMDSVSRGQAVAIRNINDGISLLQTADGALSSCSSMFQRIRELLIQGANGTNSFTDLQSMQKEAQLLMNQVRDTFNQTQFNGNKILTGDGTTTWRQTLQIGPEASNTVTIKVFEVTYDQYGDPTGFPSLVGANATGIMSGSPIGVGGPSNSTYLYNVDQALDAISSGRAIIGAQMNTLESTIANLRVANENSEAAKGRIMDADYAQETASLSRQQILQQAGTSMVAQANIQPQSVLKLLML
jgi:flagellin